MWICKGFYVLKCWQKIRSRLSLMSLFPREFKNNTFPISTITFPFPLHINYIYLSMMLDILSLSPDTLKQRFSDRQPPSKSQLFNELFSRLKDRNTANDLLIKRYIKRNNRKHTRAPFSLTLRQQFVKDNDVCWQKEGKEQEEQVVICLSQRKKIQGMGEEECKDEGKFCDLKQTNHTLNESPIQDQRVSSVPTLNIHEKAIIQKEKSVETHSKPDNGPTKDNREITKYLRNFFLNKIVMKSRLKQKEEETRLLCKKSYQGRTTTEIQTTLKYKVKVKSLVFGNSEALCPQDILEKGQHPRVKTQSAQLQRYDNLRIQDNRLNKGILPTIHNSLAARNKRCLQNYIRSHQEKSKDRPRDFRTVKLPTECQLPSAQPNRKAIISKLNTINVSK